MAKDGTGTSVMRAELDAATSSSVDVQEAQWRAGVNRQAQPEAAAHQQQQAAQGGMARQAMPDAHAHQVATSRAAADARTKKRKEREEQEQLDALAFAASEDEFESAVENWAQDSAAQDAAWDAEQPRRDRERDRAEREKQDDRAHASEPIWVQDSESGTWSLYTRGEIAGERECGFFCDFQVYMGGLAEAAAYFKDPHSEASEAWLEAQLAPGGGGPPPPLPPGSEDMYYEGIADADRGVFPPGHPRAGEPVKRSRESREEWLASLPPGEREHHELIAPRPIYDASGNVVLMEELDPEGYFPIYYFPGDAGRALAKNYGDRDSFYAWLEASGEGLGAASTAPTLHMQGPPKRSDFPRGRGAVGKAGREAFHRERRKWFKLATRSIEHPDGTELEGSLAEQNTRYDIIARRFREYSDGRS